MRALLSAFTVVLTLALPASVGAPQKVYEDSPQWNCHTMGNRVCGP